MSGKFNTFIVTTNTSLGYTYYQILNVNVKAEVPAYPVPHVACLVDAFCRDFEDYKVFNPSNDIIVKGSCTAGCGSLLSSVKYSFQMLKNVNNTWIELNSSEKQQLISKLS